MAATKNTKSISPSKQPTKAKGGQSKGTKAGPSQTQNARMSGESVRGGKYKP